MQKTQKMIMHFSVNRSALLKELNLIQGVVERKSTIPILSNLLFEAKDGALMIKGTDLDVSIATWCEADVMKEGSYCIQARKLYEIVKALPDAEIEFMRGDNDQISINCERSKFKMLGLSKDKFPEIKEFNGAYITIPADLFRTFISRTLFAITNEESRYALHGAKFELSEKMIRLVATDGHRLSYIAKEHNLGNLPTAVNKIDVVVPKKTLTELVKLTAETDESVEFSKDDNHLYIKVGKRLLISRTWVDNSPTMNWF
jgi:DNA polymerase III subunit beta